MHDYLQLDMEPAKMGKTILSSGIPGVGPGVTMDISRWQGRVRLSTALAVF